MPRRLLRTATALPLAALLLAGCASLPDSLKGRYEQRFTDYATASEEWDGEIPAWIPEDATDIRVRAMTDDSVSIVFVASPTGPTGDCEPVTRQQVPGLAGTWSPETFPDEVLSCDHFEIMTTDAGWFGWYIETLT